MNIKKYNLYDKVKHITLSRIGYDGKRHSSGSVNVKWTQTGEGYFQTTISAGGDLDGTYTGWCIEYKPNAVSNVTKNVYSSYEPLPETLTTAYDQPRTVGDPNSNVDKPENLDLVNWVINHTQRPIDQQVSATNTESNLSVSVSTSFLNTGSDVASTKWDGVTTTTGPNVASFDGTSEQILLDSTAGLANGGRVRAHEPHLRVARLRLADHLRRAIDPRDPRRPGALEVRHVQPRAAAEVEHPIETCVCEEDDADQLDHLHGSDRTDDV